MRGEDGVDRVAGDPYFPRPDTIQADIDGVLEPGAYTIAWRIVAEDGHPIQGVVPFTVIGAGSAAPSASPTAAPATGVATGGGGGSIAVIVAIALAALALVALAFFLLRPKDAATDSRRRPARD